MTAMEKLGDSIGVSIAALAQATRISSYKMAYMVSKRTDKGGKTPKD